MKIDTKKLWKRIEELVLEAAHESIPGEEKLQKVVDSAAVWLAAQTKIPIPDAIEVAVYRTLLLIPVRFVYDALKGAGRIA